jgi:hypothetical protein
MHYGLRRYRRNRNDHLMEQGSESYFRLRSPRNRREECGASDASSLCETPYESSSKCHLAGSRTHSQQGTLRLRTQQIRLCFPCVYLAQADPEEGAVDPG